LKLEVRIYKRLKEFDLNVDFCVEDDVVGLMGRSGSGKSMILKCIAGIMTPDEGKIVLDDRVLFDASKKINLTPQKRNVGYLFQSYALFDNMTVYQNIATVLKAHKIPKDEAEKGILQMMGTFHLEGLEKRYPRQLSGGQKQRVALARLLVYQPDVILLDEPFSALDSDLKGELQDELIHILKSYGQPALFVSHDREEVKKICQKIYKINKGEFEK